MDCLNKFKLVVRHLKRDGDNHLRNVTKRKSRACIVVYEPWELTRMLRAGQMAASPGLVPWPYYTK